jgi:hypothetical protein
VLIRLTELEAILAGTVDLAFRRWTSARVLQGTRLRTAIGLVEVTSVDETAIDAITTSDAVRAGASSLDELVAFLQQHPERPVFRIGLRYAGPDPRIALREQPELSGDDRAQLVARLARLDRASRRGPWTAAVLAIIEQRPGVRAADLALELEVQTVVFKRDVRKLKELGLTESLEIGYRLSPRGRAFLVISSPW